MGSTRGIRTLSEPGGKIGALEKGDRMFDVELDEPFEVSPDNRHFSSTSRIG